MLSSSSRTRTTVPAAESPPPAPRRPKGELTVAVRVADISTFDTPVAVVGRYLNTPAGGAMRPFDQKLAGALQVGIDRGIVSSLIGELAFVPIPAQARPAIHCELLIVGGMGEFGRFTHDDLSYLMSNVAVSVRLLGHDAYAAVLIGAGSGGMNPMRSTRAIVEGSLNAFDQLPRELAADDESLGLRLTLCVRDPDMARIVHAELEHIQRDRGDGYDSVKIEPLGRLPAREFARKKPDGGRAAVSPTNRVTITRVEVDAAGAPDTAPPIVRLEYTALTSTAVVPVREQKVQAYFLDELPTRLARTSPVGEHERLGQLITQYLVPSDLHSLIHEEETLTLVLDQTTAAIPWEMACFTRFKDKRFYGIDLNLTRQFRAAMMVAPGIAPPVNDHLEILIVANPAGGRYFLKGAADEARAVLQALEDAQAAWGKKLSISVNVRVGPPDGSREDVEKLRAAFGHGPLQDVDFDVCDPLPVLALMLTVPFDVIHFAGHGEFNPAAGRMGWVLGERCLVTATEMLNVCRVPRLVFANACHSAEVTSGPKRSPPPAEMTGLAEAFFAKGIENYLGTGWEVSDALASAFARKFYTDALGPEPKTLSEAAANARLSIRKPDPAQSDPTWGAYQYYGLAGAKLVSG